MRVLPTVFFVLVWLAPSACPAQTVSLGDLLETVKQNHPLFRRQARTVEIEKETQARFLGAQDWQLTSSASYAYQKPPEEDLFVPRSVHGSDFQIGLEKLFWSTGGRLSLSAGETYSDPDLRRLDFGGVTVLPGLPHYYETQAYLTYSQPLWQNRGGTLNRLEFELSEFSIELARIRAAEGEERFLLDVALRYLDWALLAYQENIARERLRLAEEQLEQVRRRREMNLVEEVDVLRALDAVHAAEQEIVQIEARYFSTQAELAEIAQREGLYDQTPEFDLYERVELPETESITAEIRQRSRLLKPLFVARRQLQRRLSAARAVHDPDLSLDLGYGMRRQEDGFLDALAITKPDAFVALNLRVPLGRREAESDIQKLGLLILQIEDEVREIEIRLESSLRSLLIEIEKLDDVLRLDRQRIESARAKAAEELRLYNQGRGQLAFVISARDEAERAELNLSRNAFVYHQLLLRYRELMDEILPEPAQG